MIHIHNEKPTLTYKMTNTNDIHTITNTYTQIDTHTKNQIQQNDIDKHTTTPSKSL